MQALRQKLHSKRGAGMVLSLLFFLVCIMVGGVVLTAATANAGRLTHLRTDQQEYFILSSAARLVRDDLQGAACTVGSDETLDFGGEAGLKSVHLRKQLAKWINKAKENDSADDISASFTIQSEGGRTVCAQAYMHGKKNLTTPYGIEVYFLLPAKEGDAAAPNKENYDMRLYIPAAVSEETEETQTKGVKTVVTTATVTWGAGVISQAKEDDA